ncbi:uncharacterized protein FA14DRAFT_170711 [Meira miltonrushii]|uniref:Uncharacterized protein n=1 Tax=Meira miltonrushii TaxID=1280837 RepID=A0A316VP92_9BASI|nr:uncharacterized protein FA14DRAFT_170711 [Meira miltonrushii]PWN37951.1 hypothetical protein FA14DRAFT_170711 [Meira miltonrushii]
MHSHLSIMRSTSKVFFICDIVSLVFFILLLSSITAPVKGDLHVVRERGRHPAHFKRVSINARDANVLDHDSQDVKRQDNSDDEQSSTTESTSETFSNAISTVFVSPTDRLPTASWTFPSTVTPTSTATINLSSMIVTANNATLPTPITTTVNTSPVPLYVPPYDPLADPGKYNVQYFGPGNGHSTVYQVVYSGNAQRGPITATMVADAGNAKLFGAQQSTVIDGQSTNVWAAVSCGYQDGLVSSVASPSAGYCIYYNNHDHVTSTWTTEITQIAAETTITPSPGAVESSIASVKSVHGQYAAKPSLSNSAYAEFAMSTQLVAILLVLVTFVYFG